MLQREVFPYYRRCAESMEYAYNEIKSHFDVESSVKELLALRGYLEGSEQHKLLSDMKICSCAIYDVAKLGDMAKELGLVTSIERFILDDRFIIPVRDISGSLVSLVGYYPDYKKYITTPSPFFSKEALFFNIDYAYQQSWREYNGLVFLVEGMFDCLSLRAIGLPAIATMGSTVTPVKKEILKLFKKVVYIPDGDAVGRRALNRFDKRYGWRVPDTATGVKISGSVDFGDKCLRVKDIDNLVSWFEPDDVREILLQFSESKEAIEPLNL